jgi:hypothetical protein
MGSFLQRVMGKRDVRVLNLPTYVEGSELLLSQVLFQLVPPYCCLWIVRTRLNFAASMAIDFGMDGRSVYKILMAGCLL